MAKQFFVDESGVKILAGLLVDKIKSMNHLSYKVIIADNDSDSIQTIVTEPEENTIYLFKTASAASYKMYMCNVTKDSSGGSVKNWLPIGETSIDLSNYYNKDELVPLTEDQIKAIVKEVESGEVTENSP